MLLQGFIAEGGTEIVFLVKDGRLMTPSPGTILEGITRKSIIHGAEIKGCFRSPTTSEEMSGLPETT